jgi:hypothetical protein
MEIFLIIKVIKVNAKMQYLKFNQFCTRFYVAIKGKYRAKAIGYEAISNKLSCLDERISLLVRAVIRFVCEDIGVVEHVQSVKSLSLTWINTLNRRKTI